MVNTELRTTAIPTAPMPAGIANIVASVWPLTEKTMGFSKITPMIALASVQGTAAQANILVESKVDPGKMMKSLKRCLLGFAIVAMICPTVASAEDDKVYPGASCEPSSSSYVYYRASGGVFNGSSSGQYWYCPAVRDVIKNGSIEYGHVTVREAGGRRPSCTLYSRSDVGSLYDTASSVDYGTTTSGVWRLTFGRGDSNAVDVLETGYLYFFCYLPTSGSGILNYYVSENE